MAFSPPHRRPLHSRGPAATAALRRYASGHRTSEAEADSPPPTRIRSGASFRVRSSYSRRARGHPFRNIGIPPLAGSAKASTEPRPHPRRELLRVAAPVRFRSRRVGNYRMQVTISGDPSHAARGCSGGGGYRAPRPRLLPTPAMDARGIRRDMTYFPPKFRPICHSLCIQWSTVFRPRRALPTGRGVGA